VGVDYWAGSSGLHHEVFDDVWLKPSWDLIEEDLYVREVAAELARGACWIPTLDLEIAWLARRMPPHPHLLAPTDHALAQTGKPLPAVARLLPFELPPELDLIAPDDEIYAFCRAHSWRVWIKGPYHEAISVASWPELERARGELKNRWQSDRLSIQAHVRGYEESVAFAAVGGVIADAVYMRKRIVTPDGKTWAGRIGEVPGGLIAPIEAAVRSLSWTGGAEIELLRDVDGRLWLNEWIGARVVFHEVTIVQVTSSLARIYDPTDAVWLDPGVREGHGAHVAVRSEAPVAVTWGAHRLAHGQWTQIGPIPDARRPAPGA
jgi:hypothetical protein